MIVLMFKLAISCVILFLVFSFVCSAIRREFKNDKLLTISRWADQLSNVFFFSTLTFGSIWMLLLVWSISASSL